MAHQMNPQKGLKYHLYIPLFALSWLLFLVFRTIMIVLGWILIPLAVLSRAYEPYEGMDGIGYPRLQYRFTWNLMYPWDNQEDGIANDTYWKAPNLPLQIIYWSAIRNPANNLRYIPYISLKIEPNKVKWIGSHTNPNIYDLKPPSEEWFIASCGPYSCWWWQFKLHKNIWRLWIGWKILPSDQIAVTGHRTHSAGFATQLKRL